MRALIRPVGRLMKGAYWALPYEVRRLLFRMWWPGKYERLHDLRYRRGDGYTLRSFDERECIFVHVPKAAGISVSKSLFGNLGGAHLSLRHYQKIFSRSEYERYFKFSFVRNPWDRLVSAYCFMKEGGFNEEDRRWAEANLAGYADFNAFVRGWVKEANIYKRAHFVPQYVFLRGRTDRPAVDFVGRVESFEVDFRHVQSRLGIAAPSLHLNTSTDRPPYRNFYDEVTRNIVSELYKEDIAFFGYEF
jgi:hypothetical protein